jgi:hypothetical protein
VVNPDPKHGRWVLPLIIAAMVLLTYTFVNSIEPADNPTGTSSPDAPFPTDVTSSTTTLPSDVAAFMVTLDIFQNQAETFADDVDQINSQWESREKPFAETRSALVDLKDEISAWENSVAQVDGVPPDLAAGHVALVVQVSDLAPKVQDIILGLEAPDDGTLRHTAVAEFHVLIDQVLAAIDGIRATAQGTPVESTTTIPSGDSSTSSTEGDTTSTTGNDTATTTTAGG